MRLEMEMADRAPSKYGVIHKAGCRDLRDPFPLGDAVTRAEAAELAEDATGWGYEPEDWEFAPCAETVERTTDTKGERS